MPRRTYSQMIQMERLLVSLPTLEQIHVALEAAEWKFAKSMPEVPHYYTMIHQWEDRRLFKQIAASIHLRGEMMRWGRLPAKPYLDLGEWRYWHMDRESIKTVLINRERIETSKAVLV